MIPMILKQLLFRSGALLLVKGLGFFIRIPLFRVLGSEGIGLYQMSYAAYGLVLTLFNGGVPTAVAILIANKSIKARFFHILALCFTFLGIAAGVLFYYSSPTIAAFLGNEKLVFPLQCLAPAVVLVPLLSLIRGYLQGLDFVGVIATSEVIEQITRSVVLLWLISYYAAYNVEASVGGANLGAPAGACAALVFVLLFLYRLQKDSHIKLISHKILQPKFQHPAFVFFQTSIAITCTRLIFPLSDFLDALIIPHRLQDAGFVPSQAIAIYGEMSGMAVTLAYLPTLFTAAISHVLTSKFSSDWKSGKQRRMKRRASLAIQITVIWGTACSLIMYLYAPDFSWIMLGSSEITGAIRYLAIAPLLCGLREILTCIHWSTGNHQKPLWGLVIAVIFSLISYNSLITLPGFAYLGIAIGILAIDFIGLCWNSHQFLWYPKRKTMINWLQKASWCLVLVWANYLCVMYLFPDDGGTQYGIRLLKICLAFSIVLLFLFINTLKGRFNLIK